MGKAVRCSLIARISADGGEMNIAVSRLCRKRHDGPKGPQRGRTVFRHRRGRAFAVPAEDTWLNAYGIA